MMSAEQTNQALRLWGETMSLQVKTGGSPVEIRRNRTEVALSGGALQPILPHDEVRPVGEVEVIEALRDGGPLLVDMRSEEDWCAATIPGAINLPFREIAAHLDQLGCAGNQQDGWDCSAARPIIAFCNGPACGQTPTGIRTMCREGYPPSLIGYYRGGLQDWIVLGLTTVKGG